MRLNLLTAIVAGALAVSAIPVAAAPLSPSGGQRDDTSASDFRPLFSGQSQNLVIPGETDAAPWVSIYDDIRGPLSPSGDDRRD